MIRHVVPASVLQNLIALALRGRFNVESLFTEAGIDPAVIGKPDALIGIDRIDRLFSLAYARAEDPWFGLHAGLDNQYGSLDLLGHLMATSSTLGDAVDELLRFKDILMPYLDFALEVRDGVAILSCVPDGTVGFTASRHHDDLVVATIYAIGRSLAGGQMDLKAVALRHEKPQDTREYERAFGGVPVHFGAARNEVHFGAALLSRRLATAYPQYHQRVEQQAQAQLQRLGRGVGMAAQVIARIEARLGSEPIGIDDIAPAFNMTARTLQRRLRDEGVVFGELRDNVRQQAARRLLLQPELAMETVAQRLGFSDTANFYHAFRRWEGVTPGAWRRRELGAP